MGVALVFHYHVMQAVKAFQIMTTVVLSMQQVLAMVCVVVTQQVIAPTKMLS